MVGASFMSYQLVKKPQQFAQLSIFIKSVVQASVTSAHPWTAVTVLALTCDWINRVEKTLSSCTSGIIGACFLHCNWC